MTVFVTGREEAKLKHAGDDGKERGSRFFPLPIILHAHTLLQSRIALLLKIGFVTLDLPRDSDKLRIQYSKALYEQHASVRHENCS